MAVLVLLVCLCSVIGTSMSLRFPISLEQFPDIIPEGWSQEDILRALSNHGNVTTTGLGPVQSA